MAALKATNEGLIAQGHEREHQIQVLRAELVGAKNHVKRLEESLAGFGSRGRDAVRDAALAQKRIFVPPSLGMLDPILTATADKIRHVQFGDVTELQALTTTFVHTCIRRWTNPNFRKDYTGEHRPRGSQVSVEDLNALAEALGVGLKKLQSANKDTTPYMQTAIENFLEMLKKISKVASERYGCVISNTHLSTVLAGPR